jgi:hypothetical protein
MARLTVDLNLIPRDELDRERGADGQWCYKVSFDLQIKFCSVDMLFEMVYKGRSYDVKVEYL